MSKLKNWEDSKDDICNAIIQNIAPLKIILKTKNDFAGVKDWVRHHRDIVGSKGLLIADNCSTGDPGKTYATLDTGLHAFQFAGFHNSIHDTDLFPELYEALGRSCYFFVFLDTDERLALFNGKNAFVHDRRILEFLSKNRTRKILPGTWLQNVLGYRDRFSLYDPMEPLAAGLKWGKPVISTRARFGGLINHNTQVNPALYSDGLVTNMFVFHLSCVTKKQRIEANLRKLRAYKAISESQGAEFVWQLKIENVPAGNVRLYVAETKLLLEPWEPEVGSLDGSIRIRQDGTVEPTLLWQMAVLQDFVRNPSRFSKVLRNT